MAYTFTKVKDIVFGNERGVIYNVTADAVLSGSVQTPLGFIDYVDILPVSMASVGAGVIVKRNTTAASAAANGAVFISTNVSGDNFFMIAFGRS